MTSFPIIHRVAGKFPALPNHVNAFLVELDHECVVVDATIALSSARQLVTIAEDLGKPIKAVLMTHGHPDHFSGLKVFEKLPRYASQGCLDFAKKEDAEKGALGRSYHGDDFAEPRVFPDKIVGDGAKLTFDGYEFTFSDLGPGESDADGMWVVKGASGTHAFIGDLIARDCHSFFRDGHLQEWMKLLDRFEKTLPADVHFYYGHGEPGDMAQLRWQRGYNQAFIEAIRAVPVKTMPVSEAVQQSVVASVQKYLPGDSIVFLLTYDIGHVIGYYWKKYGMV